MQSRGCRESLMMVVDQEGQAVGEHFMDTGQELITPGWDAWVKGSEFKRPKTPMTPDTIADEQLTQIFTLHIYKCQYTCKYVCKFDRYFFLDIFQCETQITHWQIQEYICKS